LGQTLLLARCSSKKEFQDPTQKQKRQEGSGMLYRVLAWASIVCALCAGNPAAARAIGAVERVIFIEELIAVADGEVGYQREDSGYTKYADWSGGNAYGEWCSDFASWCVNQADRNLSTKYLDGLYPMQTACATGVAWFIERGRYVTAAGELKGFGAQWYWEDGELLAERPYVPSRGDLIYFEWYKYNRIDHVGIVEYVETDAYGTHTVHTIEGNGRIGGKKENAVNAVERFAYPLDDPSIRGYGVTLDEVGADLRRGSGGPLVQALQQKLAEGGFGAFSPGDDFFGARTERAVRQAQKAHGLKGTGIADRLTQMALGIPGGQASR